MWWWCLPAQPNEISSARMLKLHRRKPNLTNNPIASRGWFSDNMAFHLTRVAWVEVTVTLHWSQLDILNFESNII